MHTQNCRNYCQSYVYLMLNMLPIGICINKCSGILEKRGRRSGNDNNIGSRILYTISKIHFDLYLLVNRQSRINGPV